MKEICVQTNVLRLMRHKKKKHRSIHQSQDKACDIRH